MPLIKTSSACVRFWWACVCVCLSPSFWGEDWKLKLKTGLKIEFVHPTVSTRAAEGKKKVRKFFVYLCKKLQYCRNKIFLSAASEVNQIWQWKWLSGTWFYLTGSTFSASYCLLLSQTNNKSLNQILTCYNPCCTLQSRVWYGIIWYHILYHGLGEYLILIGCRVSINPWYMDTY